MCQGYDDYKNFRKMLSQNIRAIRKQKNFTQETFAFLLNTSPKYIGCIERCEKNPSLPFLFRMAKVLDTDIEKFFKFN